MTFTAETPRRRETSSLPRSHAVFLALWLLSLAVFWGPLRQFLNLALNDTEYNHALVIPLLSACLLFWQRREIFGGASRGLKAGVPLFLIAGASGLAVSSLLSWPNSDYRLSISMFLLLAAWAAAFLLSYGSRATGRARFPLLFLLLMIPMPPAWMDRLIFVLQTWSTALVGAIFHLTRVPFFRHGFVFDLPGISIQVAKECSSIHSFWALLITSLLVGHFVLGTLAGKACLSVMTVPAAVLSNAVRIATIWYLATHVDPDFMYGNLHHNGGILFSLISLSILLCSLWMFRKLEGRWRTRRGAPVGIQPETSDDRLERAAASTKEA